MYWGCLFLWCQCFVGVFDGGVMGGGVGEGWVLCYCFVIQLQVKGIVFGLQVGSFVSQQVFVYCIGGFVVGEGVGQQQLFVGGVQQVEVEVVVVVVEVDQVCSFGGFFFVVFGIFQWFVQGVQVDCFV